MDIRLDSGSPRDTAALGKKMGELLKGGEVITLSGPLGAGKTAFAQGIGAGLGIPEGEIVSPTFILRAEHRSGRIPLAHVDLYRIEDQDEIIKSGLFEQEDPDMILLVEWPEKGVQVLPPDRLDITLEILQDQTRGIQIRTAGKERPDFRDHFKL